MLKCFYSCDWLILATQRLNEIPATLREPQGNDDTPEKLEAERQAAQDFIDTGTFRLDRQMSCTLADKRYIAEPLSEEELQVKEELIAQGFEDWSRRDFQQFVRALESYGWYVGRWPYAEFIVEMAYRTEDFELLASEIQDKTPQAVAAYYPVFRKKWKELAGKWVKFNACTVVD